MIEQRAISTLIEHIYDAAIDQEQWPVVIGDLCDLTGAGAGSLCFTDLSNCPADADLANPRLNGSGIAEYVDALAWHDPTTSAATPTQAKGSLRYTYNEHAMAEHPAWRFEARPLTWLHYELALESHMSDAGLATRCDQQMGPFIGHIERAIRLGLRLQTIAGVQAAGFDMLDEFPAALILFGRRGRLLYANADARRLSFTADGLRLTRGGVRLARSCDQTRLDRLIQAVLDGRPPASDTIALMRPSGDRPACLRVLPITAGQMPLAAAIPCGYITLVDPSRRHAASVDRLRTLFELTTAESRLAARLADGHDLRHAAAEQGIEYETARKYLSAIFKKTETQRQGELIRLLSVTAPYLADRD